MCFVVGTPPTPKLLLLLSDQLPNLRSATRQRGENIRRVVDNTYNEHWPSFVQNIFLFSPPYQLFPHPPLTYIHSDLHRLQRIIVRILRAKVVVRG